MFYIHKESFVPLYFGYNFNIYFEHVTELAKVCTSHPLASCFQPSVSELLSQESVSYKRVCFRMVE